MPKSDIFFSATLILFLFRIIPDSRHINPACIIKTKTAQINIHSKSIFAAFSSVSVSAETVCNKFIKKTVEMENIINLLNVIPKLSIIFTTNLSI